MTNQPTTTPDAVEWLGGMNFQATDCDGETWQFKNAPFFFYPTRYWIVPTPVTSREDYAICIEEGEPLSRKDAAASLIRRYPALPGDPVLVSDNGLAWFGGILHELHPNADYTAVCRMIGNDGEVVATEPWKMWKPWPGVTPGY